MCYLCTKKDQVRHFSVFLIVMVFMLAACRQVDAYEKTRALPRHEWPRSYKAIVKLDVADSGLHQLYLIIRHSERFEFTHLPVSITIKDTARKAKPVATMLINAPLIKSDGNWAGDNMDDLYYHRIKISGPVLLNRSRYYFILQHQLKEDPLQHILDVGIATDKITTSF